MPFIPSSSPSPDVPESDVDELASIIDDSLHREPVEAEIVATLAHIHPADVSMYEEDLFENVKRYYASVVRWSISLEKTEIIETLFRDGHLDNAELADDAVLDGIKASIKKADNQGSHRFISHCGGLENISDDTKLWLLEAAFFHNRAEYVEPLMASLRETMPLEDLQKALKQMLVSAILEKRQFAGIRLLYTEASAIIPHDETTAFIRQLVDREDEEEDDYFIDVNFHDEYHVIRKAFMQALKKDDIEFFRQLTLLPDMSRETVLRAVDSDEHYMLRLCVTHNKPEYFEWLISEYYQDRPEVMRTAFSSVSHQMLRIAVRLEDKTIAERIYQLAYAPTREGGIDALRQVIRRDGGDTSPTRQWLTTLDDWDTIRTGLNERRRHGMR